MKRQPYGHTSTKSHWQVRDLLWWTNKKALKKLIYRFNHQSWRAHFKLLYRNRYWTVFKNCFLNWKKFNHTQNPLGWWDFKVNSWKPERNGWHFANVIFKCVSPKEKILLWNTTLIQNVSGHLSDDKSALAQVMVWCCQQAITWACGVETWS